MNLADLVAQVLAEKRPPQTVSKLADLAAAVDVVDETVAAGVYRLDLEAARERLAVRAELRSKGKLPDEDERTPEDLALDGVAHHVFNTLRGADDRVAVAFEQILIDDVPTDVPVEWATFEDIRAIVAQGF